MAEYVKAKIVRIMEAGSCPMELKVGDEFELGPTPPEGICSWAYNAILPFATVLRFGGRFPWQESDTVEVCCPDANNPVVFELRAIEEAGSG